MLNYNFIRWRHTIQSKWKRVILQICQYIKSPIKRTHTKNQTKISSSTNTNTLTNRILNPIRKKWQPIHNPELNLRWWNTNKITRYFPIYIPNVGGLELSNDAFTLEEISDSMFRQAADVACLFKTNTYWKNRSSKYKTTKISKQFGPY